MHTRNYALSIGFGILALSAGALCHRLAPGLGLVLMPMFWPLAVLAALVPRRFSVTTAALVPFVSFLLTGMPTVPFIVALKFALFAAAAGWLRRFSIRMRLPCHPRKAREFREFGDRPRSDDLFSRA